MHSFINFIGLLSIGCRIVISAIPAPKYPFQDPTLPWDSRVNDLVSRLSLEEIITQSQSIYPHSSYGIPRLDIPPYTWDADCLHGYTDRNATAFPEALGLAASFSRQLIFNISSMIAEEVRAMYNTDRKKGVFGNHALNCLSPTINIMRSPLWGRNQETYGEDPYLTGELVSQYVYGLQGNDLRYVKVSAGCKHMATYAGPEDKPSSRFSFDAKVSERDLRMTFLPQFRACVKAGTYNIMCSYSSINGVPACANKHVLTEILRKEWGFKGFVISDEEALESIIADHHYVNTLEEAAAAAIKAGCNMELHDGRRKTVFSAIPSAISKGLLTTNEIVESIKPAFYTRMRLGDFDPIEMNPYTSIDMTVVLSPAHREQAVQAASMSFVLLKNLKNYLPITKRIGHLAIVGPMADNAKDLFGGYTAHPDPKYVTTPRQGLSQLSDNVTCASGCDNTQCNKYDQSAIKTAVQGANFIIICLGLGISLEDEGNDRIDLALPGEQLQLLKDAIFYSHEAPLLLLMFSAGPIDLTFAQESPEIDAIIECFYPAQATGEALYRTLTMTGPRSVPAARLPSTWPAILHQVAPITDYNMTDQQTYRYYHDEPLYPFGYGLSYSSFHYDNLVVSPTFIKAGVNVTVTVEVNNKGPYDADEVVQIYLSWTNSKVPVPRWTLVGYERPTLFVNKPVTLTFTVTGEQMAVWLDERTGWAIQPGNMVIYAGGQQPFQRVNVGSNFLQQTFTIAS